MIFFTRFESFGCVIAESACAGVPVILSDLAVTREIIEEGVNGHFVSSENEEQLAAAIRRFIDGRCAFDNRAIAKAAAEKYNYRQVALLMDELYTKAIRLVF